MNQQTIDMLTDMKLSAMATEFAAQLKDSSFNALSFEERFSMAVTAEWNKRQTNKANRLIKKAHLGAPSATVEGIEYYEDRKLDKSQMLRLSTCKYIDEGHHVILEGASGNGKTYPSGSLTYSSSLIQAVSPARQQKRIHILITPFFISFY